MIAHPAIPFCRELAYRFALIVLIVSCTTIVHRELASARREGAEARAELVRVSRDLRRELAEARGEGERARDELVRAAAGLVAVPAANREALGRIERRLDRLDAGRPDAKGDGR